MITAIAPGQAVATFPAADVANFRTITQDMLAKVNVGDQAGATLMPRISKPLGTTANPSSRQSTEKPGPPSTDG